MEKRLFDTIEAEIAALKVQRDAVILAHNYQTMDIQRVADHVGDSLYLARVAAKLPNKVVLFSGVHFMAETVSILAQDKTVLMPDPDAGCSLASMVHAPDVRKWKDEHPGGLVVCYVNTSAEVKAESDYACTSANAVQVVASLPPDKDILFIPDFFLGLYAQRQTGRKLHLWPGFCHVHARINSDHIEQVKKQYPDAELLMHPECGCLTKSMHLADKILSTGGMVKHVEQSPKKEFLIATETGLVEQLAAHHPEKAFHPVGDRATCEYMKMNTLEKIARSLEKMQYEVRVPKEIADRARLSIERMIAIG
jgi:quinolinate synthase